MPRRRKPQATKKDWRWWMHTSLNVLVALSMVAGTIVIFTGGNFGAPPPAPTFENSQGIPTLAPTVGAPTSATPPLQETPTPGPSPTR